MSRLLRRAFLGAIGALTVLMIAAIIYVITLPGVGDAEARVHHILVVHHGTYEPPPPPTKLGTAVVAVEDEHFYSNFLVNLLTGRGSRGPGDAPGSSGSGWEHDSAAARETALRRRIEPRVGAQGDRARRQALVALLKA